MTVQTPNAGRLPAAGMARISSRPASSILNFFFSADRIELAVFDVGPLARLGRAAVAAAKAVAV